MIKKKIQPKEPGAIRKVAVPRAIVGIGASAGGLEAVSEFLQHLPKKTGMAFVYVQHLDPTHKSLLAPILSRSASLPIEEARHNTRIQADHFYTTPAGKNISISNGLLHLTTNVRNRGHVVTIDDFFRSLATDQKNRSIGIILSGNASDGVLGLEAIKSEGGITFAQDEKSAKYPDMPHNAIESGAADHVLTPSGIAQELAHISLYTHSVPTTNTSVASYEKNNQKSLQKIYAMLRTKTGVNFFNYKPSTLGRRIERRMLLQKIKTLPEYVVHLEENPADIEALYRDMLIYVTEFFRDDTMFDYLKKSVFPLLMKTRTEGEPIRIWSAGCSTGEEAYSFAISFVEFLDKTKQNTPLQVFGSDLNEENIVKARSGIYQKNIRTYVSPERLERFFTKVDDHYRIKKEIRDMCIFTRQNLINDPPFSQLDIVSCRNVLIYLEPIAQKHILPLFHYALKPSGLLILGKSESIREYTDLFHEKNKTQKIYAKKVLDGRNHLNTSFGQGLNLSSAQIDTEKDVRLQIESLEREVARIKEHLQPVLNKGKNTPPKEFSSNNGEIMSFNEELQSTNEELETTKEELQSTNEELITLNEELHVRNTEMSQVNDDFTNVLHATNVPIVIVDRELRIRRFTPFAEKSLRIIPSDVGRLITDIRLPIRFPNLSTLLLDVIQTAQARHEEVEDETGRWYTLWLRPYMSLNNKIDGAVITFIDIDEIKHGQIELEQSLSYVQNILGTMREPLIVLDKNFRIKNVNAAFYRMFPITPEETEGMLLYDLKNHAWDTPKLRDALEKILPEKSSFQNIEFEFEFPNIGTKFMSLNGQRLSRGTRGEELILLAMQDLTERILLQQRNENFISTASHELKTPVTTIKTLIQILQKRFEESDDKMLVEYLTRMDDQITQLTKLVVDLLDVSKIKANKFEMEEKIFDFDILAHEIVKSCQLLSSKHIISIQGETNAMVRGDRSGISRVFINLIVNAIKYSPQANKIIITLSHTSMDVCVDVQDFGIGIAKIYQDKIFERFFQIGDESAQNFSGLGIGLYISGAIVTQHGGHISLVSKKGVGSTFSFWIPIQKMK